MAKAKKTKAMLKAKKKWVEIIAPSLFNNMHIGETYIYDVRDGIGKAVTVNMMVLTKNPKKQGINVKFLVTGQHDGKLTTEFLGLRVMPQMVRRMVRRGKDKIEDSFIVTTADGKNVRVKPLMVARSKVKGSVSASIRKSVRAYVAKASAKMPYEKMVEEIVMSKLQKELQELVSKIYPVSISEIRWFEVILKDSSAAQVAPPEAEKEAEAPVAEE